MSWISNRELKIYLFVVGVVTLAALFITIAVMLPGYIRYRRSKIETEYIADKQVDMSRFVIPESYMKFRDEKWIPFRPDKELWTSIDTGPYWQDPEILILEYLEEQNEKLINELFKDIP